MNSTRCVKIAQIDCSFDRKDTLDWLVSGASPFQNVNIFNINQTTISRVWELYSNAYGKVSKNLLFQNVFSFQRYGRWILFLNHAKKIDGFIFFKNHPYGLKMAILAPDSNNKLAIKAVLEYVKLSLHIDGVFGEISGPLKGVETIQISVSV